MKNVPAVEAALKGEYATMALPEAVIEWNMNRFIGAVAENTPLDDEEGYDIELFPVDSIISNNRPTKGINKARVGSATIGDDYIVQGPTPNGRFYLADPKDHYKYWTSPYPSDASTGALSNCAPHVIYDEAVNVNKLVFTFENTWASPLTFSIQTTTVATPAPGDWTTKFTQADAGSTWKGVGQLVLYWNGSAWVNTGRVDNADKSPKFTTIRGVRIVVTALEGGYKVTEDGSNVRSTYGVYESGTFVTKNTDGKDARFDLIEIAACLEVDLTPFVIDASDTFDLGEASNLYPIGEVTTNDATINLSNLYKESGEWVPGLFNADNPASPYHKFIDRNALVTLRYIYFDENDNVIDEVPQFKMYTNLWSGQANETVQLTLYDYTWFFNEIIPRAAMWEGLTVPEIVWRVLDAVGFTDYHIDQDADRVTEHTIPVFWTDGEKTVWEVFDELAAASQSAIYIDGSGTLQVKTRDFALSAGAAPVWTLTSEGDVTQLPNIKEDGLEVTTNFEPNHYKVMYQQTNWSPEVHGMPQLQTVWEPEGTEVLRSAQLTRTLNPGDTFFYISPADVKFWPFEGFVNIDGELIRYKGKQYKYVVGPADADKRTMIIDSLDDQKSKDSETPMMLRNNNRYTGALKITQRGEWNSEERVHSVDALGYSTRSIINGTHKAGVAGFKHLKTQSKVSLNTTKRMKDHKDLLITTKGQSVDNAFFNYGTMFRFVKGRSQQTGGIVIHNSGGTEDGYYFEFTLAKNQNKDGKKREPGGLKVYSKKGDTWNLIGGNGVPLPIGENIWYDVDITYTNLSGDHKLELWFNGKKAFSTTVQGAKRNDPNGKFGMFARGRTHMEFEYLYAIRKEYQALPDDFSFMDKVDRAYVGRLWEKEWVYTPKEYRRRVKRKWVKDSRRYNERYFDDFGPYVHEIREYDVKFDPFPILHSRLYVTNDWSTAVLEYSGDPFGAQFVIANTARINAVIHGEDTLSHPGTDSSIDQVTNVFGRALIIGDESSEIAKNDDQIRRRGKIESELEGTWVQSKHMARDVVDWMNDHFSYGNDELSVDIFGNPLIEVGDVVHVNYPDKHIDGDYFVLAASNEFAAGVSTTLRLRRRHV